MERLRVVTAIAGVFILWTVGAAQAALLQFSDLVADPSRYGTNVFLDTSPVDYGTLGLSTVPFVNGGVPLSQATLVDLSGTREARSLAANNFFDLGVRSIAQSRGAGVEAAAVAATGFLSVSGPPVASIPGSININGNFMGTPDLGGLYLSLFSRGL